MDRYASHVCLVSEQPLPNLIPALPPDSRPRRVALLVSDQMRDRAQTLKRCLQDLGCKVSLHQAHAYHIGNIRRLVRDVLDQLLEKEMDTSPVALNVTGGTKVMALGAYDVFRERQLPVFYIDTHNKSYTRLYPEPGTRELPDLVNVTWHLRAYGYTLKRHQGISVSPERAKLCRFLAAQAHRLGKTIAALNWMASQARAQLYTDLPPHLSRDPDFQRLVHELAQHSLLSWAQDRVVFADEDARRFLNGGWLENHLLSICNELKKQGRVFRHLVNVEVETGQGVLNEFDLLFTAQNRLHIIECKTGNLDQEPHGAKETIYKLEALRDLVGGTFGRAMLVSYRALNEHTRKRCREYGIEVVQGSQLERLQERLIAWIDRA